MFVRYIFRIGKLVVIKEQNMLEINNYLGFFFKFSILLYIK